MGQNDGVYVKVKLITGETVCIKQSNYVGFCHFPEHKGALTRNAFKKHECQSKKCMYFERNKNNTYIEDLEEIAETKKKEKEAAKQLKKQQEQQLEEWKQKAQEIADKLGFDIKVTSIKKTDQKRRYILFYMSREARNDWFQYYDLAIKLGWATRRSFYLKHIKDIDGSYAVY